jgi:hypothetical protein
MKYALRGTHEVIYDYLDIFDISHGMALVSKIQAYKIRLDVKDISIFHMP